MSTSMATGSAQLDASTSPPRLRVAGDWTLAHYAALERTVNALKPRLDRDTPIDLGSLGTLDTAGAALLAGLLGAARLGDLATDDPSLPAAQRALLQTVGKAMAGYVEPTTRPRHNTVTEQVTTYTPSGVSEIASTLPVNIFPSPASINGTMNVFISPVAINNITMTMYDVDGKEIRRTENMQPAVTYPIDLNGLPGGMYLVRFEYNGLITTQKVMIAGE